MPPRYAYWTIIVDDQPTAFRAGALEDIMPTFNRLKEKQPGAKLMWFQNGQLWPSRIEARESMQMRGERGRDRDPRQTRSFEDGRHKRGSNAGSGFTGVDASAKAIGRRRPEGRAKPEWKPKSASSPKVHAPDPERKARPEWKPKSASGPRPNVTSRERSERPEWKPKRADGAAAEDKRKWIPKAEYKKSTGTEAKRDDHWRPGGEHQDPRQKYKDAKKAKWTRFKQAIRARSSKTRKS